LLGHERADRIQALNLAAYVVDEGVVGKGRDDGVGVEGVDRANVLGEHSGEHGVCGGHVILLSASRAPVVSAGLVARMRPLTGGESRPACPVDSPLRGESILVVMTTATIGIGDFARATHLTIKTLRHYHRIGLLEPAEVDEFTGYRRYGTDQIPQALIISRFRKLDMPLDTIHQVLAAPDLITRNAV